MSTANTAVPGTDLKAAEVMIENAYIDEKDPKGGSEDAPPVSPFKDMPRRKAIWVFRKAVIYSMLVAWAAIMDGYLISSGLYQSNRYHI